MVWRMNDATLTFIGGGNMAASLIGGLVADGWDPARIRVADSDSGQRERMAARFQVTTTPDNAAAVSGSDAVVLAVKPQVTGAVAQSIAAAVAQQQPLIISIAAGIRATTLRDWLGENTAIVRAMPNTPALGQSGATGLYATAAASEQQRSLAESILRAVGLVVWVEDEALMDTVTALSGSGPAYFFLLMEALQAAGEEHGLSAESAHLLAVQTAFGAARMALESSEDPATLRRHVTSPGGTTERAIQSFQADGLEALVRKALKAAADRSSDLGNELEK